MLSTQSGVTNTEHNKALTGFMLRNIVSSLSIAAALVGNCAWSQTYPSRTVRIVTQVAGGSLDIAARMLAQGLGAATGQTFVGEGRPGG